MGEERKEDEKDRDDAEGEGVREGRWESSVFR